jgi:hypothetical protein
MTCDECLNGKPAEQYTPRLTVCLDCVYEVARQLRAQDELTVGAAGLSAVLGSRPVRAGRSDSAPTPFQATKKTLTYGNA